MMQDLTKGKPFSTLLKFAIPVIGGNLFQLFYTLADTLIVGKTLGSNALAAVGSTTIIIYLVLCFIQGTTGGFGICLGQRYGAKDEDGMKRSIAISFVLSAIFTVIITAVCCLLAHQILYWMQTPDEIYDMAYDYMFAVLLGTGATIFYNLISNIMRALGDSRIPLYFLVISSLLNIVLDFVFILPFGMGVAGAAWATVIAQLVSAVLCIIVGWKKFPVMHVGRSDLFLCVIILLSRNLVAPLFVNHPTEAIIRYAGDYLIAVAPFYFILGLLNIYRASVQSMGNGQAPFAACIIELIMRICGTAGLSKLIGYTGICLATPLAWIGATSLLTVVYYKMIRKNKTEALF